MNKKILIIDDEPGFMRSVIERLKIEGYSSDSIIYCQQIDEAFEALRKEQNNISCLSLDLLMGDNTNLLIGDSKINGLKALAQIRTLYPSLPIVCFSILVEQEGGIRNNMIDNDATFISKTDPEGMENLINFFKQHYD